MYRQLYIYIRIGNKVTQIYVLTCSPALSDYFGANLRTGKFWFTAGCLCERGAVCVLFWCFPFLVHRKFNITPENRPKPKKKSLPTIIFQTGTLNFGALVRPKAPKILPQGIWKIRFWTTTSLHSWGETQPQLFKYQATGLPKYPPLEELEFRSLKDSNSFQQEEGPKFHP